MGVITAREKFRCPNGDRFIREHVEFQKIRGGRALSIPSRGREVGRGDLERGMDSPRQKPRESPQAFDPS